MTGTPVTNNRHQNPRGHLRREATGRQCQFLLPKEGRHLSSNDRVPWAQWDSQVRTYRFLLAAPCVNPHHSLIAIPTLPWLYQTNIQEKFLSYRFRGRLRLRLLARRFQTLLAPEGGSQSERLNRPGQDLVLEGARHRRGATHLVLLLARGRRCAPPAPAVATSLQTSAAPAAPIFARLARRNAHYSAIYRHCARAARTRTAMDATPRC